MHRPLFRARRHRARGGKGSGRRRRRGRRDASGAGPLPRQGCPLWSRCPRHHGARDLVTAQVWVATPASLVHSAVPPHQADARIRYLELACRMSDLIIVDEADRVQMQLDAAFAPSATLVGRVTRLVAGRGPGPQDHRAGPPGPPSALGPGDRRLDATPSTRYPVAADRLYALLIKNKPLRDWVIDDYFSPFTLHQWLLNAWFPEITRPSGRRTGIGTTPRGRGRSSPSGTGSARSLTSSATTRSSQARRDNPTGTERPRPGPAHPGTAACLHRRDDAPSATPGPAGTAPGGVPAPHRGRPGRARAPAGVHPDPRPRCTTGSTS